MKKTVLIITLAFMSMAACSGNGETTPTSQLPPPETTTSTAAPVTDTSATTTTISAEDAKYMIKGAFGETLDLRDAVSITYYNAETNEQIALTPDEAIAYEGSYNVFFGDFVYAAKSAGIFLTTVDDPDMFEYETDPNKPQIAWIKKDVPHKYKYERVYVGDKAAGLTAKEAEYWLEVKGNNTDFCGSSMAYDGEATIDGYLFVFPEDGTYFTTGDMEFIPDARTFGDLPMINGGDPNHLPLQTYRFAPIWGADAEFCYTDIEYINVGSMRDEKYKNTDFGMIPIEDYGKAIHVSVTFKDLVVGNGGYVTATIVKIKLI